MDLGHSCSVTVATDSLSVIDRSRRRGHSIASKHVGLRGLWLQESLVDGKLKLEKVNTSTNPADVCTKALPGNRIRELCRLALVFVCCSEEIMGDDPNEWYLSRLDESCRWEKFGQCCDAESEGRVDFTCLVCCYQTHFALTVGHELVDPSFESVLWKLECFRHALVVSVQSVTCACFQRLLTTPHDHFMAQEKAATNH